MKNSQLTKVNYLVVILLAVIFGLGSGISGGLITRSYILNDFYNIPFFGKIDYLSGQSGRSNIVMETTKNVTVLQDNRIKDTIDLVEQSIVGIFAKIDQDTAGQAGIFIKDNHYQLDNEQSEGLIVTSDGWVLASDFDVSKSSSTILKNYVVITKDKTIYEIEDVVGAEDDGFIFLKLKNARDLPVRQFTTEQSLNKGQLVVALNWDETSHITHISGISKGSGNIKSSDLVDSEPIFTDDLSKFFQRSFVFDLNGNFIAVLNKKQVVKYSQYFNPIIKNLLKKEDKQRTGLGINYINLSDYVVTDSYGQDEGALIYPDASGVAVIKNSNADRAGLLEGDIILSINNIKLNQDNSLATLMSQYLEGDEISLTYLRDNEEKRTKIKLISY